MSNEWKKFGSIRLKDNKPYIKITEDITLPKDAIVQVQDPRQRLKDSVSAGRITEEKAEEYLANIPAYVKYDLVLPPPKK